MLQNISIFNTIFNDAPQPWQLGFQDSAAPGFTGIVELHNTIFFFLVVICVGVLWALGSIIYYYNSRKSPIVHKYLNHGTLIELIWTITPALILIAIAFPSFRLLYLLDEVISPTITIKVVGLFLGGLKLYILNKMKDTNLFGQKNNLYSRTNLRLAARKNLGQQNRFNSHILLSSTHLRSLDKDNFITSLQNQRMFYHISNIRAINRIGPHNEDVLSVIIGSTLGDAYLNKRSGEGVRICYRQSIKHKDYFSSACKLPMDPYYITGFSDGEACFRVSIYRRNDCKTGWWVIPTFTIELHKKDASILSQIKSYFGVGSLHIRKSKGQIIYTVGGVKDLMEVIIPHFTKYPLITQKSTDFILFKSAVELINQKKHLTIEGIAEIVSIRAAMNLGLTETLIESFPEITPKERESSCKNENIVIPSPYWFTGFTEAEGCFFISVHKSKSYNVGYQTQLRFSVVQHKRDEKLIGSFLSYLDCGKLYLGSNKASVSFSVTKLEDLENKIIPFFQKHSLLCSKNREFIDFCRVFFLVKSKSHLTEQGLNQILEIKTNMNKGRNNIKLNEDSKISPAVVPSKDLPFSSLPPDHKFPLREKGRKWGQPGQGWIEDIKVLRSYIIQKREFHHMVRARNRIGPHNADTLSVVFGSLLGNGHIKRLVEGSMLVVRETNLDYAQWLYVFLYNRGYTSNLQPRQYIRTIQSKQGKVYYGYEFNTFTFRSFNWIHQMFYKKGTKVVPKNIYEYLTPLALAVWIMDDGGWVNSGVRIATNSFKLKEVELLNGVLNSKFNLETTIQKIWVKDKYSIYITKKSVPNLRNIVIPFIHSSMLYKLGVDNTHSSSFKPHTYI